MKALRLPILAAALVCGALPWATAQAESTQYPVAGTAPDRRPEGAPRIVSAPAVDRRSALHGIAEPLPVNLKFLDDQGGWYTPFVHPGMLAPYDPRGWHAAPPAPPSKK